MGGWVGEREDKGGSWVNEAYEVKKGGGNYAVFYFAGFFCQQFLL
jgi:hypothetical protein